MTEGFVLNHTNSVLQKLGKMEIASLEDGQYKLELMELKADLTKNMNDEAIRKLFEELIRLDPDNQRYYEISANRSKSHIQAIRFLNLAVEKYPNDAYIINKLIERLLDYCEEECPTEKSEIELDKIENLLEKSLKLKPQIENDAYSYKYRYLMIRYKNKPQEFQDKRNTLCDELVAVSKYHP
jgi:tetratricopeptide (TPR) repeat protein